MKSPWFSLNHISHLATVEIRVVRLGSFQSLYLSFAIVEITHGVTANRDDTDFHHANPSNLIFSVIIIDRFMCELKALHVILFHPIRIVDCSRHFFQKGNNNLSHGLSRRLLTGFGLGHNR